MIMNGYSFYKETHNRIKRQIMRINRFLYFDALNSGKDILNAIFTLVCPQSHEQFNNFLFLLTIYHENLSKMKFCMVFFSVNAHFHRFCPNVKQGKSNYSEIHLIQSLINPPPNVITFQASHLLKVFQSLYQDMTCIQKPSISETDHQIDFFIL